MFRVLVQGLVYTHIWIGLAAAAQAMLTRVILGLPVFHLSVLSVFFATMGGYGFQRAIRAYQIKAEQGIFGGIARHRKLYVMLSILSLLAGAVIGVSLLTLPWIFMSLIAGAITIGYVVSPFGDLRSLPHLKIFLITLVWVFATVLFPVSNELHLISPMETGAILIERFLFIFAITIPFDIKDLPHDKIAGLKTLPVFYGEARAMLIARVMLLLYALMIAIHGWFGAYISLFEAVGLLLTVSLTAWLTERLEGRGQLYFLFILDGVLILQFLLVYLSLLLL